MRISDIHFSGHTISSLFHIKGFTLGEGEDTYEAAGGASDVFVGIGVVGDRASEGQVAGVKEQVS